MPAAQWLFSYDTTGTTLSFIFYFLSIYPEIQEKLLEEILNTIPEGVRTKTVIWDVD